MTVKLKRNVYVGPVDNSPTFDTGKAIATKWINDLYQGQVTNCKMGTGVFILNILSLP